MNKILTTLAVAGLLYSCGSTAKQTNTQTPTVTKTVKPVTDFANTITADDLKTHLYTYAGDGFEGRNTGDAGHQKAVEYIKNHYIANDISAAKTDGNYFQTVPLEFFSVPTVKFSVNGSSYKYIDDLVAIRPGNDTDYKTTDIVYAGFGIDDEKYSDYTNLDVTDKIVLIKNGEPKNDDGNNTITGTADASKWSNRQQEFSAKYEAAKNKGAKAVFFYNPTLYPMIASHFGSSSNRMSLVDKTKQTSFFVIGDKVATALKADIATNNTPAVVNTDLNLKLTNNSKNFTSENVAAVIKGSEKPEEYIIISAHSDHEGIKKGEIYNGADDDGSGTVAVLEIAQAFKEAAKNGQAPKRSVVFLHVTGEEKGLLGSRYYTDFDPIFPLENTVADLNIDMIGRTDPKRESENRNYLYLIGSDKLSTDLHNISEEINNKYCNIEFDYTYNDENDPNRFYYRSDHYNFAKNNIPVIFYFNGTHDDYHQPSDTPDKIEYDLLENRTRLIFHTAWELANRDERIVVDKAE